MDDAIDAVERVVDASRLRKDSRARKRTSSGSETASRPSCTCASRLSSTTTSSPRERSSRTRCVPMNPAPPVTSVFTYTQLADAEGGRQLADDRRSQSERRVRDALTTHTGRTAVALRAREELAFGGGQGLVTASAGVPGWSAPYSSLSSFVSAAAPAASGDTTWTLAGTGVATDSGDGGQAREAAINQPRSVFPTAIGRLCLGRAVVEQGPHRRRRRHHRHTRGHRHWRASAATAAGAGGRPELRPRRRADAGRRLPTRRHAEQPDPKDLGKWSRYDGCRQRQRRDTRVTVGRRPPPRSTIREAS